MAKQPSPEEVSAFFQQIGFSPVAAAGIVGNLVQETGNFSPAVIAGKQRGDSGTAFGLMQWRGERQKNYFSFAKENNRDPYDWRTQALFVKAEMVDPRYVDFGSKMAFKKLQTAKSPADAALAFIHAERPQGYSVNNPGNSHGAKNRISAAIKTFGSGSSTLAQNSPDDTENSYNNQLKQFGITPEGEYYGDVNASDESVEDRYAGTTALSRNKLFSPLSYGDFGSTSGLFNFNQAFSDLNPFTNQNQLTQQNRETFGMRYS